MQIISQTLFNLKILLTPRTMLKFCDFTQEPTRCWKNHFNFADLQFSTSTLASGTKGKYFSTLFACFLILLMFGNVSCEWDSGNVVKTPSFSCLQDLVKSASTFYAISWVNLQFPHSRTIHFIAIIQKWVFFVVVPPLFLFFCPRLAPAEMFSFVNMLELRSKKDEKDEKNLSITRRYFCASLSPSKTSSLLL